MPGVVHQDVDLPEGVVRASTRPRQRVPLADVAGVGERLPASLALDFPCHAWQASSFRLVTTTSAPARA
jgi:hypothetical protein